MYDEGEFESDKKMEVRKASELDLALERVNEAETQIGYMVAKLYERLDPVMSPVDSAVPQESGLDAVRRTPSQIVTRLWTHADELENQGRRLGALIDRLDV